MKNKYYVYAYLDPRKKDNYVYDDYNFNYEPFYIGKGTANRCFKHLTDTKETTYNLNKFRLINKLKGDNLTPIIIKIKVDLFESEAYDIESKLIKLIGRRCNNTGPLTNIVIDGKPPNNYKKLDDEIVKKIILLYKNGEYLKHIALKLNLNELKIKSVLIENNIIPIRKPPINKLEISEEIVNKMTIDYNNGLSIRTIKEKYSISFNIVRAILRKNNVVFRGYDYPKTREHINSVIKNRVILTGEDSPLFKKLTDEDISKLKKLRFEDHKSIREIVKIMKISQEKYYHYINL